MRRSMLYNTPWLSEHQYPWVSTLRSRIMQSEPLVELKASRAPVAGNVLIDWHSRQAFRRHPDSSQSKRQDTAQQRVDLHRIIVADDLDGDLLGLSRLG